jgi:RNA polymerase sigma-70 factor (ECF subfamily)
VSEDADSLATPAVRDGRSVYQELLVVRSQLGDQAALSEIVSLWERRLAYYVRRLLGPGGDVPHTMQDVWLKVVARIGSLHDPARLGPWLYSLARFTAIDHIRDAVARRRLLAPLKADAASGARDEESARFDDVEQVHFGLTHLDVADRDVLTLYFLNDMSIAAVAEVLNIPCGTVKSRLYHARRALAAVLRDRHDS